MKKTKKMTALMLAVMMAFPLSLAGCGGDDTEDTGADTSTPTTKVEATATPTTAPKADPTATPEPVVENADPNSLPRTETLYYGGLQWNGINGWNPLSDDMNNALTIVQSAGGSRTLMFETLYMYNMLDGSFTPLLADGDYVWNDAHTEITVKLKTAAKWSDGTALTAHDVAYTFEANNKINNAQGTQFSPYIEAVEAVDDHTVKIKAKLNESGNAVNPLQVITYLVQPYVLQKDWIQKVEARNNNDPALIRQDIGEDTVYSGPYNRYYADEQKIVIIRDDNYWGQDASMWGKLPVPKYICHTIFSGNAAGEVGFKAGEVDVCQQFIPNVQDLWLKDGLPVSTYMDEAPYGICVNMPTAWFNLSTPGLDQVAVRKAIAMAVDYDAIIANSVTNQSPSFADVPRSIMNPTQAEQEKYNHEEVADLQWVGNDIEGAKALLDEAGIVDTDGDGIREYNGENLSFNACAPSGWTDWMAAIEIVAAAGEKIGIEITSEYPDYGVYQTVVTAPTQDQYDIFMMWTDSATPTQPWGRARMLMSSEYNGVSNNWSGNWGHYSNPRVDELLQLIPSETDEAKVKEYYTELVKIYLTDVPSFSLMYRPNMFHCINESVWTNFPDSEDGRNIPPLILSDGYGIRGLYEIELVK